MVYWIVSSESDHPKYTTVAVQNGYGAGAQKSTLRLNCPIIFLFWTATQSVIQGRFLNIIIIATVVVHIPQLNDLLSESCSVCDQVSWPAFVCPVSCIDILSNVESHGRKSCNRGSDPHAGGVTDTWRAFLRVLDGDYGVLCLWHGWKSGGNLRDKFKK